MVSDSMRALARTSSCGRMALLLVEEEFEVEAVLLPLEPAPKLSDASSLELNVLLPVMEELVWVCLVRVLALLFVSPKVG